MIVIGYGNAGIGAAKATLDEGGTVIVLEKAPREEAGGSLVANDGNWSYVSPEALVNGSFGTMGWEFAETIEAEAQEFADWLIDECDCEFNVSFNSIGQEVLATESGFVIW